MINEVVRSKAVLRFISRRYPKFAACRLPTGDTADYQSALQKARKPKRRGAALPAAGQSDSTDGDEGDAFAFVVAGDALGVGVEGEDAVDEEGIAVVAVL